MIDHNRIPDSIVILAACAALALAIALRGDPVRGDDLSLNRFAARRDENEPGIVDALLANGFDVYRLDKPLDLLVWRPNGFGYLLLEVKTASGRITDDQESFFERTVGLPRGVVKTAEEALELARRYC